MSDVLQDLHKDVTNEVIRVKSLGQRCRNLQRLYDSARLDEASQILAEIEHNLLESIEAKEW